ncbi:NERD domain-containing protein [Gracilibacillus massiliensis]|uniref:NERD domain-containing protein n=1 Tax=Gracilibacillus massiliensis TaxID=1564956 RepID=UPI00071D094E|nr:NERD domain-containing protein [Gracilibacillus massiliensis]
MNLSIPHKSFYLQQLEATIQRLSHHDCVQLEKSFGREIAGYTGEKNLPYYLDSLPSVSRLFGIRLPFQHHFFQIDGLVVFPKKIFICEVKHLKGKITLNQSNQLIQETENEQIQVYDNPLIQAQYQKDKLESFLSSSGFQSPSIHPVIVFTHPGANLNFQQPDIIPIQQLPIRMKEILLDSKATPFSTSQLKKLTSFLSKNHQERQTDILAKFKISPKTIKRGVFCSKCVQVKVTRIYGTWYCPKCGTKDKNMHVKALKDWALIFGPTITNKQARYFLDIESIDLAKRLLNQRHFPSKGTYRNRKHDLSLLLNKC